MNGGKMSSVTGRDFKPPNINPRVVAMVAVALVVAAALAGSVFKIEPEQVGLVLTFGEYTRIADPGSLLGRRLLPSNTRCI